MTYTINLKNEQLAIFSVAQNGKIEGTINLKRGDDSFQICESFSKVKTFYKKIIVENQEELSVEDDLKTFYGQSSLISETLKDLISIENKYKEAVFKRCFVIAEFFINYETTFEIFKTELDAVQEFCLRTGYQLIKIED